MAVKLVVDAEQPPVVRQANVREAQILARAAVDDHVPVQSRCRGRQRRLRELLL
jgi:hypothetical protein